MAALPWVGVTPGARPSCAPGAGAGTRAAAAGGRAAGRRAGGGAASRGSDRGWGSGTLTMTINISNVLQTRLEARPIPEHDHPGRRTHPQSLRGPSTRPHGRAGLEVVRGREPHPRRQGAQPGVGRRHVPAPAHHVHRPQRGAGPGTSQERGRGGGGGVAGGGGARNIFTF